MEQISKTKSERLAIAVKLLLPKTGTDCNIRHALGMHLFRPEGKGHDDVHVFVRCEVSQRSKLQEYGKAHMKVENPIWHFRSNELDRLASGKYDRKGMMKKYFDSLE